MASLPTSVKDLSTTLPGLLILVAVAIIVVRDPSQLHNPSVDGLLASGIGLILAQGTKGSKE